MADVLYHLYESMSDLDDPELVVCGRLILALKAHCERTKRAVAMPAWWITVCHRIPNRTVSWNKDSYRLPRQRSTKVSQ